MGEPEKKKITLGTFIEYFEGILLLITCLILFVNVVTRALGFSLKWAEEFTRYAIVWITFVGSSICIEKNMHVGIDVLPGKLNDRGKVILKLVVDIISLAFAVAMTYLGVKIVAQAIRFHQKTAAMMISMAIPYAGIPVGCLLMSYRYIQQIYYGLKKLTAKEA